MEHAELTKVIIGCAYRVFNAMGFGFLESIYEKCMMIELRKSGLVVQSQQPIKVYYDGEIVGDFIAELLVEETVIVELKAVSRLVKAHEVQLVNYLVVTGFSAGLVLNFGEHRVEVKRKVRVLPQK